MVLEDNSIMPIGTHKGKPMKNVPISWYEWFFKNGSKGPVMSYIYKNLKEITKK